MQKNSGVNNFFGFLFFISVYVLSIKLVPGQTYTETNLTPTIEIDSLPIELNETSALVLKNESFYTLNDSYCPNSVYCFNRKGKLTGTISLQNARNNDWEELLDYKNQFYIGDFGNNDGTRNNLCIYFFHPQNALPSAENNKTVSPDSICFKYPDQYIVKPEMRKTAWDCESMVGLNDSLFLFTKRWNDYATVVYKLPAKGGTHIATRHDSLNIGFLVTAAAYEPTINILVLLGYRDFVPYISIFYGFCDTRFFNGKHFRINLENMKNTQPEGIAIDVKNKKLYFTSETTPVNPQRLFSVPLPESVLKHKN